MKLCIHDAIKIQENTGADVYWDILRQSILLYFLKIFMVKAFFIFIPFAIVFSKQHISPLTFH